MQSWSRRTQSCCPPRSIPPASHPATLLLQVPQAEAVSTHFYFSRKQEKPALLTKEGWQVQPPAQGALYSKPTFAEGP
jgi:hypothetical protein